MIEFAIIRTDAAPGDEFDWPVHFKVVMHPTSIPYKDLPSGTEWGGLSKIEVEGCLIEFIQEMGAVQVTFECDDFPPERAVQIMHEVLGNIEAVTGQEGAVIGPLGDQPIRLA